MENNLQDSSHDLPPSPREVKYGQTTVQRYFRIIVHEHASREAVLPGGGFSCPIGLGLVFAGHCSHMFSV